MLYSTDWHDFVIYPLNPELGDSLESRTNTDNAIRKDLDGSLPDDYSPDSVRGIVIQKNDIELNGDTFQAILINQFGNVMIWTSSNLWTVVRMGNGGAIEKIQYVPLDHNRIC